jgi:(p)ppGpp synthase/HD superfamily hydrolase
MAGANDEPVSRHSPRFELALAYAATVHAQQTRRGTSIPYVYHLLAVAALVGEHGGDEEQVIAALLHDAPEDQGGQPRLDDIEQAFGARVARIVRGCTDTLDEPKPPWRPRKEAYILHLAEVELDVLLVSAADKLHNARAIVTDLRRDGVQSLDKFNGGRDGTLWYYASFVRALEARLPAHAVEPTARLRELVSELRRTVGVMQQLAALEGA